ncbi:DUF4148 domain-containing protein [Paraburkholderia nodosa]|uniref:DUF4148 domain-containing protein n=1 Tax=Paraburkholderia nodosa TaxID=392320 RepID=UPI0009DE3F91|nr:DUF4148 domain-containing protein [Paraburkholderia nodosa]
MKLVQSFIIPVVVTAPAVSYSQQNQPFTWAEVREQLVLLKKTGYNPSSDHTQYPRNIEAAQARLSSANAPSTSGT